MRKRENKRQRTFEFAADICILILGSFLYACSVNIFTAPNRILVGGFTGIATLLHYLFGLPIGLTVLLLNIPLFVAAYFKFGTGFLIKTAFTTAISSVLIDLTALFLPVYTGDLLLCALFGGLLCGMGLGLIFLRGATTGGADIIAKLLRLRFPSLSMGRTILLIDGAVILASFFVFKSLESMLYAAVVIFVSAQAIDYLLYGTGGGKLLFAVTENGEQIARLITGTLNRGVTVLPVTGGYTNKQKSLLLCAVRANEISAFAKTVTKADENAFLIITDASEIRGEGFKRKNTDN